MIATALCMLLAAQAGAGEAPPPITHYESVGTLPAVSGDGPSTELAMADDGHDRLTVPVHLGASGPFRFLVDTGSDRTSVSSELVRRLGLAERQRALMHSATGSSQVRMAYLPELQAGRRAVRHINAPMLDAADIGADGILGIDSLRSQRVVFDFAEGRLAILSADSPTTVDEGAIVVRARRREGRLIVTDAEVDGQPVSVVIDTGSALTVGNAALRRKLERRGGVESIGVIDLISVTGASLRGELGTVKNLDIGGARLESLNIVFAEAHTFRQLKLDGKPALLLGMNALRGFDQVSIDFAGKTLLLVLPKAPKRRPA
jgi:predicted aspartyl protease